MHALLQYTLDLFGASPLKGSDAGPAGSAGEAPPAGPITFMHPRATRQVRCGDACIGYALERGRRRSIGFVVGAEGLSVRAPRGVTLRQVDAAVLEKSRWVLRKLSETRERHERLEALRIDWRDGVQFDYLGAPLMLQLAYGTRRSRPATQYLPVGAGAGDDAALLRLELPATAEATQIGAGVQRWLIGQARTHFAQRLDHFAPLLGVHWRKLTLSSAATRWGSASADGAIRLNWRLIHLAPGLIDYVVAHELAHLRVMNHSPQFWDVVASVVPDHMALRRQLKDESVPRW
ncbi:MAG: SprT family zinc-dependent metalloprotease [Variovorax sp.]